MKLDTPHSVHNSSHSSAEENAMDEHDIGASTSVLPVTSSSEDGGAAKTPSPFKREYTRYQLDTSTVIERSLDDEFLHVLSIIHRQEPLDKKQSDYLTWEVVEYWKDNVNPGFLDYRKSVSDNYTAIEWRDGEEYGGAKFYGIKGNTYIDCLGGFGIYNVGHRHPVVVSAVRAQLRKQALHSQELLDPLRAYCAHLLSKITPGKLDYAFFANSGTEAVEACLKMAILSTGRHHFVALIGAFHGKTLGSLACTSKKVFRGPFVPALMNVHHLPINDIGALKAYMEGAHFGGNPVAGIILEPIMGEGGIFECDDEYLWAARELCDKYGALLIFDEVQSGMGRTGTWWACEKSGVVPDLMAIAKGFGGGVMPVGACVGTKKVWEQYIANPFIHTTTFGGNPLAMAAAIATMFVIHKENLLHSAQQKGERFKAGFFELQQKYPSIIKDVRGRGLMLGLEFPDNETGYLFSRCLFTMGVLVAGTLINAKVIRVEPPLTIKNEEIDLVLSSMDETCQEILVQRKSRL